MSKKYNFKQMDRIGQNDLIIQVATTEEWNKIQDIIAKIFPEAKRYKNQYECIRVSANGEVGVGTYQDYRNRQHNNELLGHAWTTAEEVINNHNLSSSSEKENDTTKMEKFYRLKKSTATHEAGAVFVSVDGGVYRPTDDVFSRETANKDLENAINNVALGTVIVENSPEWFERVYKRSSIKGAVFVTKKILKDLTAKLHIGADEEDKE